MYDSINLNDYLEAGERYFEGCSIENQIINKRDFVDDFGDSLLTFENCKFSNATFESDMNLLDGASFIMCYLDNVHFSDFSENDESGVLFRMCTMDRVDIDILANVKIIRSELKDCWMDYLKDIKNFHIEDSKLFHVEFVYTLMDEKSEIKNCDLLHCDMKMSNVHKRTTYSEREDNRVWISGHTEEDIRNGNCK